MIETKEKVIDNHSVMVTQFPGRRALFFKTRLLKLAGPALAQMFTSEELSLDAKFDHTVIAKIIDKLAESLDENEFVRFVIDLLQCTRVDGKEITESEFDMLFAGNLLLMYKILWFTLEVNYGSFFGQSGIGKILSKIPQPLKTKISEKSSKR